MNLMKGTRSKSIILQIIRWMEHKTKDSATAMTIKIICFHNDCRFIWNDKVEVEKKEMILQIDVKISMSGESGQMTALYKT